MSRPMLRLATPWVLLAFCGCAGYRNYRRAEVAEQTGDWDQAVVSYMRAVADDPGNVRYRADLLRVKMSASQAHFKKAQEFQSAGALERALVELQQAVDLDPTNQYAAVELRKTRSNLDARAEKRPQAPSMDEMKKKARDARPQPPVLSPRSKEPISLDFPSPVSIFDIYRALGKAFGINILFDPALKDQQLAIELKDVTAQDALETLMRSANHFYKVVDERTIIIAADNPQNRRNYEDLVIQTFFLSNAEVKDVMQQLRGLVDAKRLATNDQLNAIIMRDTADRVKVAQKIIETNDKSKSEVVVDVELLQINTTKLRDLGISLVGAGGGSGYQITQTLDLGHGTTATGTTGTTTTTTTPALHLSDIGGLNQNNWILTLPSFVYSFIKQSGDAQLLAQPKLRITEGESGKLTIGDRVPIPVTSFNTAQTVGGNIVPLTSFQYQDVGIKIDITPRVHHNKEVTLKLKIEVSNLASTNSQAQPVIGTRSIESTIRLKDGETNFLAGLIRTDESNTKQGIPGLSEIPLIGRLFSHDTNSNQRTDLILTLTPHIVRTPDVTEDDLLPIWVGTEANTTFRGNVPRVESEAEGPFDESEPDDAQQRELIRRRMEQLPRGLQDQRNAVPGLPGVGIPGMVPSPSGEKQPQGINLAPAGAPSDIFKPPPPPPPPAPDEGDDESPPSAAAKTAPAAPENILWGAPVRASYPTAAAVANRRNTESAVRLQLIPARDRAEVGEEIDVALAVDSVAPVSHVPVALQFDPSLLAVVRVSLGDFLGRPGEAEVLSDTSHPGELLIGASRLGKVPGVAGRGIVAKISFRLLGEGKAAVSFLVGRALGADLNPLGRVTVQPAVILVAPARETPERRPPAREGVDG